MTLPSTLAPTGSIVTLAFLASASFLACAAPATASTGTTELATLGDDSAQVETNLESVGQSFVGASGGSLSIQSLPVAPSRGAAGITAQDIMPNPAGGFFQPAGCLVENVDTAKRSATYTFSDCTGPLGLSRLRGTVTATWTVPGANQLHVELSSSNFQVDRATVDSWSATADVTESGSSRDMKWNATLSGTTGSGRAFHRTNAKDVQWTAGSQCLSVSGTSEGTIGGMDLKTTLSSYSRCAGACPASGSSIEVEDVATGATVSVEYLGGATAELTTGGGRVVSLTVACGL